MASFIDCNDAALLRLIKSLTGHLFACTMAVTTRQCCQSILVIPVHAFIYHVCMRDTTANDKKQIICVHHKRLDIILYDMICKMHQKLRHSKDAIGVRGNAGLKLALTQSDTVSFGSHVE